LIDILSDEPVKIEDKYMEELPGISSRK